MYADDLQINYSRPRKMRFECIREVNSDLSRVFEWSLSNSLKLNPSKSMVLPIYRNHLLGPLLALFLDDADVTPFAGRMRLVVAFVIPFFIYCDCVHFALDSYSLRKLTVAFNACVRYVYRKRLFDHISDVSDLILGCSLLTYMEFRLACFMFFLVTAGDRPRYLYDSFVFLRSERTLRINWPRIRPLSTWLGLCWPVESGLGTCSQSQLGLSHHFRALNGLFVNFCRSRECL
jgi:hypothetical protein